MVASDTAPQSFPFLNASPSVCNRYLCKIFRSLSSGPSTRTGPGLELNKNSRVAQKTVAGPLGALGKDPILNGKHCMKT